MTIYTIIYFSFSVLYLAIGFSTYFKDHKSITNKLFLCINFTLFFWSACLSFMSFTTSIETAALLRRITIIFWSYLYAELLFFLLELTNKKKHLSNINRILLFVPPTICFIVYFFDPIPAEYMVKVEHGWAYAYPDDLSFLNQHVFNLYYITYVVLSILALIYRSKKAKTKREYIQSRNIYISILVVAVLASITDVIMPLFGITTLPPVTVLIVMFALIVIWYSMYKYGLMDMSSSRILMNGIDIMPEGIIILGTDGEVESINQGALNMLELSQSKTANAQQIRQLIPSTIDYLTTEYSAYECKLSSFNGNETNVLLSSHITYDMFNEPVGIILYFQDMTQITNAKLALINERDILEQRVNERTQSLSSLNEQLTIEVELRRIKEDEIKQIAHTDYLTSLPNRRMFNLILKQEIKKSLCEKTSLAILFIDLDRFKLVNDSLGHSSGDFLLKQISKRLKNILRKNDYVARLGGDEFAVIITDSINRNSIQTICDKILNEINKPVAIGTNEFRSSASIGVALFPDDTVDADEVIKYADIAMYAAKEKGRNCYSFFDKEKISGIQETMHLTNDLHKAIENNELFVQYQPQVSAKDKQIVSFEALVRWNHPVLGLISPIKFIPIAERTGLIHPIGEMVFRTACQQLKQWNNKFNRSYRMAVNISVKQLEDPNIVHKLKKILDEIDIDAGCIELETTESILMTDVSYMASIIDEFKKIGLSIAIDDFGTEYSSLNYIKNFSVDKLKIPKPFIDGINKNNSNEFIISSTIQLAKNLGLAIVAEGVEEAYQYEYLQKLNCELIQGYYFYKPLSPTVLDEILEKSIAK